MSSQDARGSIKLIIGCMFSGKSTHLINSVERYQYAKKRCVIIKHTNDTRYDHLARFERSIICNSKLEYNSVKTIVLTSLSELKVAKYDVIGVMESQFFDDLLIVDDWANSGKIVICDGLDGDFNRTNFGQLHLLIPKCEEVVKLHAVCIRCGANASFTRKLIASAELIDIGGIDKYVPVCRKCYIDDV